MVKKKENKVNLSILHRQKYCYKKLKIINLILPRYFKNYVWRRFKCNFTFRFGGMPGLFNNPYAYFGLKTHSSACAFNE